MENNNKEENVENSSSDDSDYQEEESTEAVVEDTEDIPEPKTIEELIYVKCRRYVYSKVERKYGLTYEKAYKTGELNKYWEAKDAVIREVYLALRSKSGQGFINHFTATVCSVNMPTKTGNYLTLSNQLRTKTNEIKSLTLLALSSL